MSYKNITSTLTRVNLSLVLFFIGGLYSPYESKTNNLKWTKKEFSTSARSVTSFAEIIEEERELLFFGCYETGNVEVYERVNGQTKFKKSLILPAEGLRDISAFKSGDGQYTVAIASELAGTVMVLQFLEDSHRLTLVRSYRAQEVSSIAISDLNADGFPDFLVGAKHRDSFWLENKKNQGFTKRSLGEQFVDIKQIRSLDYNKDGYPDILAASEKQKGIVIGINNTDGTFELKPLVTGVSGVLDFSVKDIDNDQDQDIVVASFKKKGITVFKNVGGKFVKHDFGKIKNPTSIAAIDLSGQGDLSFLVSSFEKSYVTLFYSKGGEIKETRLDLNLLEPTKLSVQSIDDQHFRVMASSFATGRFTEINLNLLSE